MRNQVTTSLARRFALAAAALAVSALLLTALASWWLVWQQHTQAARILLQKEADLNATLLNTSLRAIVSRLLDASESSLLANALVDSAGRQTYLMPYLNGLQRIDGLEVQLLFTDFEGKEIASSTRASFSPAQVEWLKKQLASGHRDSAIFSGPNGDELVITELLSYSRTASPEGAVMYKILLADLQASVSAHLLWGGRSGEPPPRLQARPGEAPDTRDAVTVMLDVPERLKPHRLRLVQTPHRDKSANGAGGFGTLMPSFVLISLFAAALATIVLLLGMRLAPVLTRDLRELEAFSRSVVENGFGEQRANIQGSEEVVGLARSINHMLDRLYEQHARLQHESEERYRLLVEGTNAISWEVNLPDWDYMFVSPQVQQILGVTAAQFGAPGFVPAQMHGEDKVEALAQRHRAIAERRNYQCEYRFRRGDGTYLWLEEIASVLLDDLGRPHRVRGILLDIDERKQTAARLLAEHTKIDQLKSEFVSTVSHELRTPLTSIRGSLGLVLGGVSGEIPPAARKLLDIAHNNSERLVRLINDLLDIDKIASGKMDFDLQWHELLPLIEQSLETNAAYAANYGVRYVLLTWLPGIKVKVDYDRLLQVMANLLSNAAKYSPRDGVVAVSMQQHEDWVRVSVVDHGAGISDEFRKKIFQKFSQADSSDTRQKGGTGLGLAITRALIEKMGGEIDFESNPGKGTTFYFDLPL